MVLPPEEQDKILGGPLGQTYGKALGELSGYSNTPKSAPTGAMRDNPYLREDFELLNRMFTPLTRWQRFQNWTARHCGWKEPFPSLVNFPVPSRRPMPVKVLGETEIRIAASYAGIAKPLTKWQKIKKFFGFKP